MGFRPFIWHIAKKSGLNGIVTNTTEGVFIKINVAGEPELLKFISEINKHKPAPALIEKIEYKKINYENYNDFIITKSFKTDEKFQLISPDIATCSKCVLDINNSRNLRRYNYPFTNCTNCGPRFTIIKKMPYDRFNTTMAKFKLCSDCQKEYQDPMDRRFHAQPNACIICGPKLLLVNNKGKIIDDKKPIFSAVRLIKKGKIVGLKSLGGFQIACDAKNNKVVAELRKRKNRPSKPFAVMFKDLNMIKNYLVINKKEEQSLILPVAPIVLLQKKQYKAYRQYLNNNGTHNKFQNNNENGLSFNISFYNKYEGALLPYTPIHYILFKNLDIPLVMTSGNISEEPIASDNNEALERLSTICDYFLIHDRDIFSKYDDSVIKIFNGKEMIIRRARGYAPYPIKLDIDIGDKVILAVGAQEKNTFCLLKKNYAILSQHTGDLDTIESFEFFKKTLDNYKKLFGIDKIDIVVYDKHPDYISTRFAKEHFTKANKIEVQHHKVHIAGVIAENMLFSELNKEKNTINFIKNNNLKKFLGFAWDGTGYGDDGKIWGSEIFIVDPSMSFKRVGHLQEKYLPGGEITIKKPCRMTLVYLYKLWCEQINKNSIDYQNPHNKKSGNIWNNENNKSINFSEFVFNNLPFYKKVLSPAEIDIVQKQIETGFNSPITTSMGRFFDAVSSLLNLTHTSTYEGEAAIHLEMIADNNYKKAYKLRFQRMFNQQINNNTTVTTTTNNNSSGGGCNNNKIKNFIEIDSLDYRKEIYFIIDDYYIFSQIFEDIKNNISASYISAKFHNTLAEAILYICCILRKIHKINIVVLSGGVFQNSLLLARSFKILKNNKFGVFSNFKVPVNDGGISLGQAYLAAINFLKKY